MNHAKSPMIKRHRTQTCHISYHIISYHIISYHIISYHIISYHIISYHIISISVSQLHHLKNLKKVPFFLTISPWDFRQRSLELIFQPSRELRLTPTLRRLGETQILEADVTMMWIMDDHGSYHGSYHGSQIK